MPTIVPNNDTCEDSRTSPYYSDFDTYLYIVATKVSWQLQKQFQMTITLQLCIPIICCLLMFKIEAHTANFHHGAALLNGAHIVVSVFQNPPFDNVFVSPNGTIDLTGATRSINEWLSRKFNFSFSFALPPPEDIANYGGFTATTAIIQKGIANITASSGIITPERRYFADEVMFPTFEESIRMAVPRPSEEDRLFAFILPFDLWVWALLAVSSVITVLIMACLTRTSERLKNGLTRSKIPTGQRKQESFTSLLSLYSMWVIDILTNHGDYLKHTNINSFLVFVSFWLLGVSVLIYGYSCIVVSSLTAPRLKPAINSYEDLLANKEVAIIIRTDLAVTRQIFEGQKPIFKQLTDKAKRNSPESIINNVALTDKLLATGRYALPWLETYIRFFIGNQYKAEKKCRFQESERIRWSSNYFHQFISKDAGYKEALNYASMQLWEAGLVRMWVRNLLPRAEECFAKKARGLNEKQASIKLVDLTSAFFIFGVGIGLSLLAFVTELAFRTTTRKKYHH